jgi:hypothetical protein
MRLTDVLLGSALLCCCNNRAKTEPPEYFTDNAVKGVLYTIVIHWKSDFPEKCPTPAELVAQHYVSIAQDGWGRDLRIYCSGRTIDEILVISDGKDGKPGTADDVVARWPRFNQADGGTGPKPSGR